MLDRAEGNSVELKEVVLSGCSAGGVGSMNNIDWLNKYLNKDEEDGEGVKVRGLPFSGMFAGGFNDFDGTLASEDCAEPAYNLWS